MDSASHRHIDSGDVTGAGEPEHDVRKILRQPNAGEGNFLRKKFLNAGSREERPTPERILSARAVLS